MYVKPAMIENTMKGTNPMVVQWKERGYISAFLVANIAGAWTLKKNNHPADPKETNLSIKNETLPFVFISLHLQQRLPFEEQVVLSLLDLLYPFRFLHFWVHLPSSRFDSVLPFLSPLRDLVISKGGTFKIFTNEVKKKIKI